MKMNNQYIYVSHSERDSASVESRLVHMRRGRYSVFRTGEFRKEPEWRRVVDGSISRSLAVLLYLTPDYFRSPHCIQELELSIERFKPQIIFQSRHADIPDWFRLSVRPYADLGGLRRSNSALVTELTSVLSDIEKMYSGGSSGEVI